MWRNVATIMNGGICGCGAIIWSATAPTVFVDLLPIAVRGALTSHGGVMATASNSVYAEMQGVCGLGDIPAGCPWIHPTHPPGPIIIGNPTTYISI